MSEELTKAELLEKAKELEVEGRSSMNKEELEQAVADAEGSFDDDAVAESDEADEASDDDAKEDPAGAQTVTSGLDSTAVGNDVKQEDVIDYPAPLAEREGAASTEGDETADNGPSGAFHSEPLGNASVSDGRSRLFEQKAVFYTDGLSGAADHNQDRAYKNADEPLTTDEAQAESAKQSESEASKEASDSE